MNILFRWSLVGNRVLPLRMTDDVEGGYRIHSESNPDILYFCAQLGDYDMFLNNLAAKLALSNGEMIGMRLMHSDIGDPLLIAGLEAPVAIPLNEPTNLQWRKHLEQFSANFQASSVKNAKEIETLQNRLDTVVKENKEMNLVIGAQTREIELMRLLMGKIGSGENNCECSCSKEGMGDESISNGTAEPMDQPSTSSLTLFVPPSPEQTKPPILADAVPTLQTPPSEKKNTSEELLWGVAQYIFCQLCPEKASDIKGMENHFMTAHVDKEKKNCEACPSETVADLAVHVQQHSSRVYACEFCGKRGRKHFLKSHIRTHTGERPFSCQTCGRCFSDASTLRRHQLVHSGVKKHSCPICGVSIARKDNVKVHIRSHGTDAAALMTSQM